MAAADFEGKALRAASRLPVSGVAAAGFEGEALRAAAGSEDKTKTVSRRSSIEIPSYLDETVPDETTPTSSRRHRSRASLDLEDLPQSIYDYSLYEKIHNDDFDSMLSFIIKIDKEDPTELRGLDRALILSIGSRKFRMAEFLIKNGANINCSRSIILEKEVKKIKDQKEIIPFLSTSEQTKVALKIITRCKEVISYLRSRKIFVPEDIKIQAIEIPELFDILK